MVMTIFYLGSGGKEKTCNSEIIACIVKFYIPNAKLYIYICMICIEENNFQITPFDEIPYF